MDMLFENQLPSTTVWRTSPGRDGLGHHLFKHSGELMREEVLALINKVWESGCLPKEWKHAVIIPIVKPGKKKKKKKNQINQQGRF